jgi:type IV pilus assembly protein PilB
MSQVRRLGELLVEAEAITEESLARALEIQSSSGERLGSLLLRLEMVDSQLLALLLARQHNVEPVNLQEEDPTPEALALLSREQAYEWGCLPVRVTDTEVAVAMIDPCDKRVLTEIERTTSRQVRRMVAPQTTIYQSIMRNYPPERGRRRAR